MYYYSLYHQIYTNAVLVIPEHIARIDLQAVRVCQSTLTRGHCHRIHIGIADASHLLRFISTDCGQIHGNNTNCAPIDDRHGQLGRVNPTRNDQGGVYARVRDRRGNAIHCGEIKFLHRWECACIPYSSLLRCSTAYHESYRLAVTRFVTFNTYIVVAFRVNHNTPAEFFIDVSIDDGSGGSVHAIESHSPIKHIWSLYDAICRRDCYHSGQHYKDREKGYRLD